MSRCWPHRLISTSCRGDPLWDPSTSVRNDDPFSNLEDRDVSRHMTRQARERPWCATGHHIRDKWVRLGRQIASQGPILT